MLLLLSRPITQVSDILAGVLTGENYQSLSQEIYQFLINNQKDTSQEYFSVFLAFSCSLELYQLTPEVLTFVLSRIL
jgi:hypothetical protein